MTDRDRWGLRGPVQTCDLKRTWYFRQCGAEACETQERGDATQCEFRRDGSLIRRRHRNPDGSEWIVDHEYDAMGRLTTVRADNGSGRVDVQASEYDAAGRLSRRIARAADGSERISETYTYDAAGRQKKTVYVDQAAQRPNTQYSWSVEGTDALYSAPGAATLTTTYDSQEHPIELLFHNADGRLLSRVEFRYDKGGRLIEEAQSKTGDGVPPEFLARMNSAQIETVLGLMGGGESSRRLHRYDAQGRRVETHGRLGPIGENRKTVSYNERGDPVGEINEDESREYAIDEQGGLAAKPGSEKVSRSEARIHYEYDPRGNWVKKVVESRGATTQEFTTASVESRTLTYYVD